jgi:PAS domain S-box-containing protein
VTGLVGISKDITERKRADEALRKSEASLRLAQRIGRIGSWEADLTKNTLFWSEETYRIFGCWPDNYAPSNRAFIELVHPDDRETVGKAAEHALQHGKYYSVDYRVRRPDGFERYLVEQARIVRDESGNAVQMLGTVQDITERKLAEEALRESEGRFRILFERSPEAIFILDPHAAESILPIVDCNEAACAQSGHDRRDLLGHSVSLLDEGIRTRGQIESLLATLRGTGMVQRETSHRRKDGTALCVESSMSLLVLGQRELLLCMNRDVSERRKAEESIRLINEQLEARVQERTRQLADANRELEAFTYSISHDLRAPVRAINGFAQMLCEDHHHKLDGEMRRLLGVIAGSAVRMGELIDDLLAFSRLNAQQVQPRMIGMTALAKSVIDELSVSQPTAWNVLQLQELPDTCGDESMIRQVFANLIGNALKFSQCSDPPHVVIGAASREGENIYFVQDNGVGFEMKYADKLFQVFQRLHPSAQFEGTGVGLAIVHRIISRHGGRVWAEGRPGGGATFYFGLPITGRVEARVLEA